VRLLHSNLIKKIAPLTDSQYDFMIGNLVVAFFFYILWLGIVVTTLFTSTKLGRTYTSNPVTIVIHD